MIKEVIEHLTTQPSRLVTLTGFGGFGKTSIAKTAAHRLCAQGILVHFISLKSVSTTQNFVSKLLVFLGQQVSDLTEATAEEKLCQSLRKVSQPLVIILDNTDDLQSSESGTINEFYRLLHLVLQQNKKIRLLLTTRVVLTSFESNVHTITIEPLSRKESTQLLGKLVPGISQKECNQLATVWGDSPLAQKLIGSTISETHTTPQELLAEARDTNVFEAVDTQGLSDDCKLDMSIEISFKKLSENEKQEFGLLSLFPAVFDADASAAVLNYDSKIKVKKTLASFNRKSLIQYDESSKKYSLHKLLQDFGHLQMERRTGTTEQEKLLKFEAKQRYYYHYLKIFENFNNDFLKGQSLSILQSFETHIEETMLCLLEAIECNTLCNQIEAVLCMSVLSICGTVIWSRNTKGLTLFDKAVQSATGNNEERCEMLKVCKAMIDLLILGPGIGTLTTNCCFS